MSKYAIGVDFGTLSGRAVLVDVQNGAELASSTYEYPHAVMDEALPDGTPLGPDWALEHPADFLQCLSFVVPEARTRSSLMSTVNASISKSPAPGP